MNRTRSISKTRMFKLHFTGNRPEQLRAAKIIFERLPHMGGWIQKTEYKVKEMRPVGGTDLTGVRAPRLDIALWFKKDFVNSKGVITSKTIKKIAIRLMGPPHDERNQELYDNAQKAALEYPGNDWLVVDFWYHKMPHLWETPGHKKLPGSAIKEVQQELEGILELTTKCKIIQ